MKALVATVAAALAAILLAGCAPDKTGPSDSLPELRKIVAIALPARQIKWEVFGTPEYTGGVPAPTDFVTLVAELEPVHDALPPAELAMPPAEPGTDDKAYIVPEAARPWLSAPFRAWLQEHRNQAVHLPAGPCSAYRTTISKSGRPVAGFLCRSEGRMLIYLTLSSDS